VKPAQWFQVTGPKTHNYHNVMATLSNRKPSSVQVNNHMFGYYCYNMEGVGCRWAFGCHRAADMRQCNVTRRPVMFVFENANNTAGLSVRHNAV
jgi:hypothetical protein